MSAASNRSTRAKPHCMRVAITGSTGLVGKALVPSLQTAGWEVVRLVRTSSKQGDAAAQNCATAQWDPSTGTLDLAALGHVDAVIHLAGENIAAGPWNKQRKRRIAESRGPTTQRLCQTLAALDTPPRVLISASATGIYGDRGAEELNEQSSLGDSRDFLTHVATDWEAGTKPLSGSSTRIVNLRIGLVLDRLGGALSRMLPPFRFGLGGRIGNGSQWMSWITLHDLIRAIHCLLVDETLCGPVLAVAPSPVTNREFTQTLGKVLRRPTIVAVPSFALKWMLGDMATLLLGSQRAHPHRLLEAHFEFEHPDLESGLRAALAKKSSS